MYQGDRPGLTDKMNLVAQRQRRAQGQLATDVVARTSYADIGDLVTGHGANDPQRVPLGPDGFVLTARGHAEGGVAWSEPLQASSGVGATAVIAGTTPDSGTYAVSSRGSLLTTDVDNGAGVVPFGTFNVYGDIDDKWFSFTGGPRTVQVAVDSVIYSRLEATVELPHAGGVLLPDRFCWAGARRIDASPAPLGIDVRPDLNAPIQFDSTWEDRIGHGGDLPGFADWAYHSSTAVFVATAGTVLGLSVRMISLTTSGNGTLCKAALSLVRLGDPSSDTPDLFFF